MADRQLHDGADRVGAQAAGEAAGQVTSPLLAEFIEHRIASSKSQPQGRSSAAPLQWLSTKGSSTPKQAAVGALHCSLTHRMKHEPAPPAHLEAFKGAYYVKRATSQWSCWSGIEATITLGQPQLDEKRVNAKGEALDGFSTYLGGNANGKREIDAGLSWDYVRNENGKFDKEHLGWRPFYRNTHWHWANKGDVYWKAGETVTITLTVVAPGRLHMHVADAGANPKKSVDADFDARGWMIGKRLQFKRVNAIDQSNNEGKRTKPTASKVVGGHWLSTELMYRDHGKVLRVPMSRQRTAGIETPRGHARVTRSAEDIHRGGESVDIYGNRAEIAEAPGRP